MANAPRNYWMLSVRPEYYDVCVEDGFTTLGVGRPQRRRAQRMEVGDRALLYVTGRMTFGATLTITSAYFEDRTPRWPSPDPKETFAWRVETRPDATTDAERAVDARLLAPRLEYVKRWPPEDWPLAFAGLLHLIPKRDFQLIERELRRGRVRPDVALFPDPRHGPRAREAQFTGRL